MAYWQQDLGRYDWTQYCSFSVHSISRLAVWLIQLVHEWETPEVSGVRHNGFIDIGSKLIPSACVNDNTRPTLISCSFYDKHNGSTSTSVAFRVCIGFFTFIFLNITTKSNSNDFLMSLSGIMASKKPYKGATSLLSLFRKHIIVLHLETLFEGSSFGISMKFSMISTNLTLTLIFLSPYLTSTTSLGIPARIQAKWSMSKELPRSLLNILLIIFFFHVSRFLFSIAWVLLLTDII